MNENINLSTDRSQPAPHLVFKVADAAAWQNAQVIGVFHGAEIDLKDGFVHLSTAQQVGQTLAVHFAQRDDLVLVGFDPADLGSALRWEPSRGGAMFPHFYGPLDVALVREFWRVTWRNGAHVLIAT